MDWLEMHLFKSACKKLQEMSDEVTRKKKGIKSFRRNLAPDIWDTSELLFTPNSAWNTPSFNSASFIEFNFLHYIQILE